jgi:septal ring factor EnvC (AmiA/AmiB activator)
MGKKRRSVSVDEEVDEILKNNPNASALVNALVKEYEFVGSSRKAALQKKIADKESELQQTRSKKARLESKIDRLEREITDLRDRVHGLSDEERKAVRELVELCTPDKNGRRSLTEDQLHAENQAVTLRASEVGMEADRLVAEVRSRL